jgi:hypothetical protein
MQRAYSGRDPGPTDQRASQVTRRSGVRKGIILATLGVEALLFVWTIASAMSGKQENLALSHVILGLMLNLLLPAAIVLGGAWLMRTTTSRT